MIKDLIDKDTIEKIKKIARKEEKVEHIKSVTTYDRLIKGRGYGLLTMELRGCNRFSKKIYSESYGEVTCVFVFDDDYCELSTVYMSEDVYKTCNFDILAREMVDDVLDIEY